MELEKLYIGGIWMESREKVETVDPSRGEPFGEVFIAGSHEVDEAFTSARGAFSYWRTVSTEERIKFFERLREELVLNAEKIASLIAKEQGKPYGEAIAVEVIPAIDALDFYIKEAKRYMEDEAIDHWQILFRDKRAYYYFESLGVVAVVSPWNYPFIIPFLDTVAALFTGNTVVLKPSSSTPKIGLFIGYLFDRAGFPPGTLNVVVGRSDVGEMVITHPDVRAVLFTGSVETGKRIMELASRDIKKSILELGGKDPAIVLDDADIERAVRGIVWGALMNAGQTCASVERVYVQSSIYDEFLERVLEFIKTLKVGNPLFPDVDIGPMTTEAQRRVVAHHVEDAVKRGAEVLFRSVVPDRGFYYPPTVIVNVDHSMRVMKEETFGPVIPVMKFDSLDEAIKLANDTNYGLTASIWTRNRKQAEKLSRTLEAGTVTVNDHIFTFGEPRGSWGGVKHSGIGRTHGKFGLLELVNIKFVSYDFTRRNSQFWWYRYDKEFLKLIEDAVSLFFSPHFTERMSALIRYIPGIKRLYRTTSFANLLKNWRRLLRGR